MPRLGSDPVFPLLLVGMVLLGRGDRHEPAEPVRGHGCSALPARRGRDLSTVVWATVIGSVFGPNLSGPGAVVAGWLHIPEKTGPFVFTIAALLAAAAVMGALLRPDPLLLALLGEGEEEAGEADPGTDDRPWAVIFHTPLVLAAAVGMALSHAVGRRFWSW